LNPASGTDPHVRLFTALEIPEDWRTAAAAAQHRLSSTFDHELRLVRAEQLHVTVRFLGEVDPELLPALTASIEAMPALDLSATLAPAGTFGPVTRPTVAWLGIDLDAPAAEALVETLDAAIVAAGLPAPEGNWTPHLTLARVRREVRSNRRRELAAAIRELPVPPPRPARFHSVSLFESELGNRAPNHKLITRSAVG
jgi:2'-5' RNA ligase